MRLSVTLDPDVAAGARALQKRLGISLSDAINELARRGLAAGKPAREPFVQETFDSGLLIDVTHIGDVLVLLDTIDESPEGARP